MLEICITRDLSLTSCDKIKLFTLKPVTFVQMSSIAIKLGGVIIVGLLIKK